MPFVFSLRSRRPLPKGTFDDGFHSVSWTGCAVMGIVNVTPDSFSDGGLHLGSAQAIAHARQLVKVGALVVDVGGESTRPGAEPVPLEVEIERVLPVIGALAEDGNVVISIDTYKSAVAAAAIEAGAHIVNDVSGLADPEMAACCGHLGVPMVVMHMKGTPRTMQVNPQYDDVVAEVSDHLLARANTATAAGVPTVLVDPGIGFGKNLQHNLSLLRALPLVEGQFATLVGASRKRSIGELAGVPNAAKRDPGSIAMHLDAARRGVAMVRVHDVAGHVQALAVQQALLTVDA